MAKNLFLSKFANMKLFLCSVLLFSFVTITTQDIRGRKGCDCSICNGVNNKLNPLVGKKVNENDSGKSSCNICERKKEMLRLQREKQQQLQKCPFEILGAPAMKGKTSEEIFDEFRETIVPSQNGFFDMMRDVVRTMHGSSVLELKWAKEKEAKELAKKRKQEAEEAKKLKEIKPRKDEIVGMNHPVNPKVTVVLKQTPCGQIIPPSGKSEPQTVDAPLMKRHPKDAKRVLEEEIPNEQRYDIGTDYGLIPDYIEENALNSDLIDQLIAYNMLTSNFPENEAKEMKSSLPHFTAKEERHVQINTESPFFKFIGNEETKALFRRKNSGDDIDMGPNLVPSSLKVEMNEGNKEIRTAQNGNSHTGAQENLVA